MGILLSLALNIHGEISINQHARQMYGENMLQNPTYRECIQNLFGVAIIKIIIEGSWIEMKGS